MDASSERATGRVSHVEQVMGMAVSFTLATDDEQAARLAIAEAAAWLHHVDATFSTYKNESPISQYGRGERQIEDLSDEILSVLDLCDMARVDTDGAFDANAVKAPNGTSFDPSGLVKGWSVEGAAKVLERHGLLDFTINAGGDIVQRGASWTTGIRHPHVVDQLVAILEFTGSLAIATSATYERGDHIVDPRTGAAPAVLTSVTIVGPDLTQADIWATALFVLGVEGTALLPEGYDAFLITNDHMTLSTPGFDAYRTKPVSTLSLL
jgi:FAD:protein FMN transferase